MPQDDLDRGLPSRVAGIAFGVVLGVLFGLPLGFLLGIRGPSIFLFAILAGWLMGTFISRFSNRVAEGTARTFLRFLWPSGNTTPYAKTYSREQALAVRGDETGALEAYETAMALNPEDPEPRIQAAELYYRGTTPGKAAPLFAEARRLSGENRSRELYATQRLIDLYLGPLADQSRALVELRRLVERFPGTPESVSARAVIAQLKAGENR
jgi:hypothetical protein